MLVSPAVSCSIVMDDVMVQLNLKRETKSRVSKSIPSTNYGCSKPVDIAARSDDQKNSCICMPGL